MPEFAVIAEVEKHRKATPIDHPDLSVTRAKLEYPTVDVSFTYLEAIGKVTSFRCAMYPEHGIEITVDSFTDKALEWFVGQDMAMFILRRSGNNYYFQRKASGATTADNELLKLVAGTSSRIGYEAVDLNAAYYYWFKASASGSTLKVYRDDLTTPKFTVTDTSVASGNFGIAQRADRYGGIYPGLSFLRLPSSVIPSALVIVETEVVGRGVRDDPLRPKLSQNLVEISQLTGLPDFLYAEAKEYEMLRARGFTDEEIELLLGYIPQYQVDLDSVTWGAFEFSEKNPTNIIVVTGDNPYKPGAIDRQKNSAKRAFSPPSSYGDAVALYNQLKNDNPNWLAGKDSFAYQVLGHEELEPLAVIDFYYGELIEHRMHYNQIKRVPDWEMRNTLRMWSERLERVRPNLPPDEYEKHRRKLGEIFGRGW